MRSISLSRANGLLLLTLLTVALLYFGRLFLMPLAFALLLAMLLRPVSNWLENRGVSRGWAALLCLLLVLAFVAALVWLVAAQGTSIAEDWPQLKAQLQKELVKVQLQVQQRFGVEPQRQMQLVQEQAAKASDAIKRFGASMLKSVLTLVGGLVLVLLYLYFLLWQRRKFRTFALKLVEPENRGEVAQGLEQVSKVGGQYLMGRLASMVFLALIYSVGFSIIGLKNALLLSVIAVLPTIVPYVGAYIGAAFPLTMALASSESGVLLPVVGVIVLAQFLDNNIIEPIVMGQALHLSPFFTIIAVVLGELIWGIPGMILFEPMFAIVRIGCRHIPALQPYAYLLEDELNEPGWLKKVKGLFGRKKEE
ncbi:AI-2E family transporter [Hymenobacter sp. BT175]|uniref:AI-2E family transporter n=1 Tax=Hymenobacter translucens TaxID=2886507 RepID=UPI001D0E88E6|nr:AI-2E family transporter [Hymenobacter translucens]MCC2547484.1 AI-2E family transporter [Hymenobacter translucens]